MNPPTSLAGLREPRPVIKAALYGLMIAAAVGVFAVVRLAGESLGPSTLAAPAATRAPAAHSDTLFHVLLALSAILVTGRLLGTLFRYLGQPPVIGEMIGGILLGPSLLGRVWPAGQAYLLPPSVAPYLGLLAQLGVILYMFLVGLELNASRLRARAHAAVAISHASIVAPFTLGSVLALWLFPNYAPGGVPFTSFALFMGVALSVTAFPVLARILADRSLQNTELGILALGCAAADDATAWCLLAFVVGVARSEVGGAVTVAVSAMAFVIMMLFVVRPAVQYARQYGPKGTSQAATVSVLLAVLLSSLATEAIGIHAVFGAFLLGAILPSESSLARHLTQRLEAVVTALLLPAFFAYTGLRTRIDLIEGWTPWLVCGAIIAVATAGKFGGTYAAARLSGLDRSTSTALGLLMNTRGLMELIVLNIGLDLGVISPELFAMMVIMALATTLMTAPALSALGVTADAKGR